MRLGRIMLFVKNVRETANFYIENLDLVLQGSINDDLVELDAGGVLLALHKWDVSYRDVNLSPLLKLHFIVPDVYACRAEV